jgi:hypothetical protein
VPLTHEQLATLRGVGRSHTSRVIQAFKAEGVLETRRGSILVRNREARRIRSCLATNPSKSTSGKCCAASVPRKRAKTGEASRLWSKISQPNRQQTIDLRRFLTILQRNEQGAPGLFWPGFLFGREAPLEFQVLSVIRKSGSRFSGEIALQPLSEPEEQS